MATKDKIAEKLKEKIEQAKHTRDELFKKQDRVSGLLSEEQKLQDAIKISRIKRKLSSQN